MNKEVATMKPIRILIAVPVLLVMTWYLFNVGGDRTQWAAAAAQKASEADLRREKYTFEIAMTAKIVVFRRLLYEMNVQSENASSQFRAGTDSQSAELETRLAALEKNLTALDASSQQDWKDNKSGVEHTFADLKKSFEQATARFN
jgi:hypothetical protein